MDTEIFSVSFKYEKIKWFMVFAPFIKKFFIQLVHILYNNNKNQVSFKNNIDLNLLSLPFRQFQFRDIVTAGPILIVDANKKYLYETME